MDITKVAKASGLPASTLRFYEEKGLIRSIGRVGLRRLFSADVLERLALIALARSAGFSLGEIVEMFTPEGPDINRALLLAKADELDRKIKELTAMRVWINFALNQAVESALDDKTSVWLDKAISLMPGDDLAVVYRLVSKSSEIPEEEDIKKINDLKIKQLETKVEKLDAFWSSARLYVQR